VSFVEFVSPIAEKAPGGRRRKTQTDSNHSIAEINYAIALPAMMTLSIGARGQLVAGDGFHGPPLTDLAGVIWPSEPVTLLGSRVCPCNAWHRQRINNCGNDWNRHSLFVLR